MGICVCANKMFDRNAFIIHVFLLKIKSNHHEELKRIRRNLSRCFSNISGFLLPHPGKAVVTKQAYDGTVKGKLVFYNCIVLLVQWLYLKTCFSFSNEKVSKQNLIFKVILSKLGRWL